MSLTRIASRSTSMSSCRSHWVTSEHSAEQLTIVAVGVVRACRRTGRRVGCRSRPSRVRRCLPRRSGGAWPPRAQLAARRRLVRSNRSTSHVKRSHTHTHTHRRSSRFGRTQTASRLRRVCVCLDSPGIAYGVPRSDANTNRKSGMPHDPLQSGEIIRSRLQRIGTVERHPIEIRQPARCSIDLELIRLPRA